MTAASWWEERPDRLLMETDALDAAGIAWSRADPAAPGGMAELDATVDGPDGSVTVRASYPDDFPYFPPRVSAPDVGLTHHHEHGGGVVCLLASGGRDWAPSLTLAWLLTEQWPKVLAANAGDGTGPDGELIETDQAEPWTAYVQVEPGSVVVLDGQATPPTGTQMGGGVFAVTRTEPLTAVVMRLDDETGDSFFGAGAQHLSDQSGRPLWWVRLDKVPEARDPASLWKAAEAVDPQIGSRAWAPAPKRGTLTGSRRETTTGPQAQVVLVCVPEETGRRRTGLGWIALVRYRAEPRKKPGPAKAYRVRRAGRSDLYARAPGLSQMQTKTVVVVGTGGLGSAVVIGLGQTALARLVLVDADEVDMAAAVRFEGAFRWGGLPKLMALSQTVIDTQPYTELVGLPLHLGRPRPDGASNTIGMLAEQIGRADLVIDATADLGAQQLLSDMSRSAGTAYLQTEATPGVWAGLIALYPPGADLCWVCVQHHLDDKTIPELPHTTAPSVQPPGCLEPTYPGTGFDLAVIAAQAVRQAVSYLTDGPDGYGPPTGLVVTVRLRDLAGTPVLPDWQEHPVGRHPRCANHP